MPVSPLDNLCLGNSNISNDLENSCLKYLLEEFFQDFVIQNLHFESEDLFKVINE